MKLEWADLPGGGKYAPGEDWIYQVSVDTHQVALTRWYPWGNQFQVAAESALYAIKIRGVQEGRSGTPGAMVGHLQDMAQEYESGLDVIGQPAWRHGYQGAPS